jgi:hypothetical protein
MGAESIGVEIKAGSFQSGGCLGRAPEVCDELFLAGPSMLEVIGVKTGLAGRELSAVELRSSSSTMEIGLLLNERGMYSGEGEGVCILESKSPGVQSSSISMMN